MHLSVGKDLTLLGVIKTKSIKKDCQFLRPYQGCYVWHQLPGCFERDLRSLVQPSNGKAVRMCI